MDIEAGILEYKEEKDTRLSNKIFAKLIQPSQLVGDLYTMNYEKARILVHDKYRHDVKGIPGLSFLIASRIDLANNIDFTDEDSTVMLLRVLDSAPLPNSAEAERKNKSRNCAKGKW